MVDVTGIFGGALHCGFAKKQGHSPEEVKVDVRESTNGTKRTQALHHLDSNAVSAIHSMTREFAARGTIACRRDGLTSTR